jgi:hypothetical protein
VLEIFEQVFVVHCLIVAVHKPDFGRGVLFRDNPLLRDKTDFFEEKFVVYVLHGYFQGLGALGTFHYRKPVFLAPFFSEIFCIHPRKIQTKIPQNHFYANFVNNRLQTQKKSPRWGTLRSSLNRLN